MCGVFVSCVLCWSPMWCVVSYVVYWFSVWCVDFLCGNETSYLTFRICVGYIVKC